MRYPTLVNGAFGLVGLLAVAVRGDGVGLIGWGKDMYNPTCAFACCNVIKSCRLRCTPLKGGENHGTAHSPVSTPPECFVTDVAFLRTMAICISTYCPRSGNPRLSLLEDYWASHLATGTVGDYKWIPAVSYPDALLAAREDQRRAASSNGTNTTDSEHGRHRGRQSLNDGHDGHEEMVDAGLDILNVDSPLPIIKAGEPLRATGFIAPGDWQLQFNGMRDFETNETGHSAFSIAVMLVALLLPVSLSLLGFVPGLATSYLWAYLKSALVHPAMWGTHHREPVASKVGGAIVSFINVIFLVAPYVFTQPQSTFGSTKEQSISIIGNRAGVMAMGNVVAAFVFAARNSPLLCVTDWSYSTYLLLHRWLGYWVIIHTVLHSVMLLAYYKVFGSYEEEIVRPYWMWGIVGTVAAVALLPTSLLVYCYRHNWGYEIWMFIAGGIWGAERISRLARMAFKGCHTATVKLVEETDGEYIRIDVDYAYLGGVAYLCFPTLGWRFWESHPFSVASSYTQGGATVAEKPRPVAPSTPPEKSVKESAGEIQDLSNQAAMVPEISRATGSTFFARTRTGQVLPYLYKIGSPRRGQLYWATRKAGLLNALKPELDSLPGSVRVDTEVGRRLDLDAILRKELTWSNPDEGPLGIVVCGPPGMADGVRQNAAQVTREGHTRRPWGLVDEAFSW
ncbi:hypothetical protein DL766_000049 [Monosporascus sp. MC13-8B]|uniref:Ferric oxidoreductase domain-containing protein n=1 Tax=Monosporascus cannonballus TaxID=155416 RepID=A0ABY0HJD1_9PEZI|nr:hypothetical protein DL762_000418 [Monosporascus cannonballus]RYP40248.1 hypothetical protein DL766_000049 [Monosporascus sp. MC13-8B]